MNVEKFQIPYPIIEEREEGNRSQEREPQYELDVVQKRFLAKVAMDSLVL